MTRSFLSMIIQRLKGALPDREAEAIIGYYRKNAHNIRTAATEIEQSAVQSADQIRWQPSDAHGPQPSNDRAPTDVRSGGGPGKFKTTEMIEDYRGEHLPDNDLFPPRLAKYLTTEEREAYRLSIHDQKLYDAAGNGFDTTHSTNGKAIWVTDQDGNMYGAIDREEKRSADAEEENSAEFDGHLYHSSFFAGQPVSGAGELRAVQGELEAFSDKSGHYEPRREYTEQVIDHLRSQGLKIDPSIVQIQAPN